MTQSVEVRFVQAPDGAVTPDCFEVCTVPLPEVPAGGVLTENLYLSCDPYMRGRMGNRSSYAPSFKLGEALPARVVARVIESDSPAFQAGDIVWGFLRWETHTAVHSPAELRHVDEALGPLSHAISVRGMPGLTAEVGLLELGRPRPGDTVFVSAASGAVGSIAGQLAKQAGARVIGSAGSDQKVEHIRSNLGFDAAFNYKTTQTAEQLSIFCPDGIDVYFDNVGGATLEAVLQHINPFARIPVCGQISGYDGQQLGVRGLGALVAMRAEMRGFVIYDHMHKFDTFVPRMAKRLTEGSVRYFEDIVDGIENAPAAFIGMMKGDNLGKRLVRLTPND